MNTSKGMTGWLVMVRETGGAHLLNSLMVVFEGDEGKAIAIAEATVIEENEVAAGDAHAPLVMCGEAICGATSALVTRHARHGLVPGNAVAWRGHRDATKPQYLAGARLPRLTAAEAREHLRLLHQSHAGVAQMLLDTKRMIAETRAALDELGRICNQSMMP